MHLNFAKLIGICDRNRTYSFFIGVFAENIFPRMQVYCTISFPVMYRAHAGADPGFDQGGPQIVTGLKLPFWGLSFVEFWCWGLIFGGQGGPGRRPPWIRP